MKIKLAIILVLLAAIPGSSQYAQPNKPDKVVVESKDVLFNAKYFSGVDGSYQVGSDSQRELQKGELAEVAQENKQRKAEINAILKVLEDIREQLESLKKGTTNPNPPQVPPPAPSPDNPPKEEPEEPEGPDLPEDPSEPTQLDSLVFDIFVQNCVNCHGQDSQLGGLKLVDISDKDAPKLHRQSLAMKVEIFDRVNGHGLQERGKTRMPKGGQPLTDSEVNTILFWLAEAAEQEK